MTHPYDRLDELDCGCVFDNGTTFPCAIHQDVARRQAMIAAEFPSLAPLWYEAHQVPPEDRMFLGEEITEKGE